jgi:multiple sugar transport system substrate-binding protein
MEANTSLKPGTNRMAIKFKISNFRSQFSGLAFPGWTNFTVVVLLLMTGCSSDVATSPTDSGKRLAGVKLQLIVVDDPAIAAEIRGLKDEWFAETGSQLEVTESTEKTFVDSQGADKPQAGDAAICPEYLLGPLAESNRLASVPHSIARDPKGPWSQTFELLRNQEALWGNDAYGVPLGSPVFCCYCRTDLLDKLHRKPPQTWKEYEELARLLHEQGAKSGVKCATIEPLASGWAGLVLLARAAAYAKQRDNYTTLFDEKSLEPAIAGPPFRRALEELVAAAKLSPAAQLDFDPVTARAEFWKGNAAMVISWPSGAKPVHAVQSDPTVHAAQSDATNPAQRPLPTTIAELPGAREYYQASSRSWHMRSEDDSPSVPFLGIAGRMGVVRAESQHAAAAFELLLWLTDPQWGSRVFAASPATTLFRNGQVAAPTAWVEGRVTAPVAQLYAEQTAETLARRQFLASLRIPGRAEYLAALDDAVRNAVEGKQSPAEALQTAAQQWRKINERLGPEKQSAAYLHSLGLQ